MLARLLQRRLEPTEHAAFCPLNTTCSDSYNQLRLSNRQFHRIRRPTRFVGNGCRLHLKSCKHRAERHRNKGAETQVTRCTGDLRCSWKHYGHDGWSPVRSTRQIAPAVFRGVWIDGSCHRLDSPLPQASTQEHADREFSRRDKTCGLRWHTVRGWVDRSCTHTLIERLEAPDYHDCSSGYSGRYLLAGLRLLWYDESSEKPTYRTFSAFQKPHSDGDLFTKCTLWSGILHLHLLFAHISDGGSPN